MLEENAGSVGELIDKTQSIASVWRPDIIDPQELWFRGQPRKSFELLPGVYRTNVQRYHFDEASLFVRFKTLAAPLTKRSPANDWEWYFLAQHYGLPTRLLDWTNNLLAAAYFAICEAILCDDRLILDDTLQKGRAPSVFDGESPVVWVIDAGTLNKATCGDDNLIHPGGPLTLEYLPEQLANVKSSANELPLALLAPRTDERIIAQQGVFTVHGHSAKSLESIASGASSRTPIHLARIVLDRGNLPFLWEELQLAGVGRLALFPDLDSVAAHVKWLLQAAR